MPCITMEVEPRIGKNYKCHYCCVCKYYRGKVTEVGGKSVFALFQTHRVISGLSLIDKMEQWCLL